MQDSNPMAGRGIYHGLPYRGVDADSLLTVPMMLNPMAGFKFMRVSSVLSCEMVNGEGSWALSMDPSHWLGEDAARTDSDPVTRVQERWAV
jgi:hypothetical protein